MNRKIHDPTMVHSSIALLQERFRQLQRVKEMREKRELLKMLSTEPKHFNFNSSPASITQEPITRLFFHPELININSSGKGSPSPPPPPHVSLSLWPTTSQGMMDDNNTSTRISGSDTVETLVFKNLCCTGCTQTQSLQASWKNNFYDSGGVDTSLHL